ncbi:MFS transporter [Streptomyces sp. MST-110588]|uniref:MFS transporter n=1 Tax=Streptomyces sp. MST-110588 TaxID=2833628 RepID=UPI001F5E08C8|nr:MFS transporter [Streptomyces sp. MST-110588]UNO42967.1 MHS family MFS transporter [Streptomyces sp. MST-110588]
MAVPRTPESGKRSAPRQVITSSYLGSVIEWYDFLLYGTAAALVFDDLFFPGLSATAGLLASFGTLAAGYLARPLGGLVLGHYGDRAGRKPVLVLSVVLMGVSSFLIGLLPDYHHIGIAAPLLLVLLRLVQGFAVGGEWGGAALMAIEHARPGRRGLWGAFAQMGAPSGLLLSSLVLALFSALPAEQFRQWGWRIPFLFSAVLVALAYYIRRRMAESPVFSAVNGGGNTGHKPPPAPGSGPVPVSVWRTLVHRRRAALLAVGVGLGPFAANSVLIVFVPAYAKDLGYPRPTVLTAMILACGLSLLTLPAYAALSDRLGRRPVYIAGALLLGGAAFVLFPLVDSGSPVLFAVAYVLSLAVLHAAMYGPMAALLAELFPTRARCTGASLGYQAASVLGGSLAPLIAAWLVGVGDGNGRNTPLVAGFMAATCLVSAVCAAAAPETHERPLDAEDGAGGGDGDGGDGDGGGEDSQGDGNRRDITGVTDAAGPPPPHGR